MSKPCRHPRLQAGQPHPIAWHVPPPRCQDCGMEARPAEETPKDPPPVPLEMLRYSLLRQWR